MASLAELHPVIQCGILRLTHPDMSFESLGQSRGISKQAMQKQCKKGIEYLMAYGGRESTTAPCTECDKHKGLVSELRRHIILRGVELGLLTFFKAQVRKFYPAFKVARLPPEEKKKILDWCEKFKNAGGLIKDFARQVRLSPETLAKWKFAYEKHGLEGLRDKTTRPRNFGHRVPLWIKKQLVALFMQFPQWTPYQYHSHIRHNTATRWYVCLSTIEKLKTMYQEKSEAEKDRIRKRWCFAPGTKAWTIDFTCIQKTENYKLQLMTVSDHRSRYLLHAELYLNTSTEIVVRDLEDLFIRYGKPDIIKADNGPEFRIELRDHLKDLAVYLFNSPVYYGQFCGAHERIHRTLKTFIEAFDRHQSLTKLVTQVGEFKDQYNYKIPMDSLDGKTPSEIFLQEDDAFTQKDAEVVKPYQKDDELRMKFTNRDGNPARVTLPHIPTKI